MNKEDITTMIDTLSESYKLLNKETEILGKQIIEKRKLAKKNKLLYIKSKKLTSDKLKSIDDKTVKMRKLLAAHIIALRAMKKLHNINVYRLKEMIVKLKELEKNISKLDSQDSKKNNDSKIDKKIKAKLKSKTENTKKAIANKPLPKKNNLGVKKTNSQSPIKIENLKNEVKEMMKDLLSMRNKRNEIFASLKKIEKETNK